jgi:hypothetical protein
VLRVRGAPTQALADFAEDGRMVRLTIECSTARGEDISRAEINARDLRQTALLRSLRQWHDVGREVARQILAGVPEREIAINGQSATEALRSLAFSSGNADARAARGARREDLLRAVADAYREAVAAGNQQPRVALAARFGYTPAHIGKLLVAARRPRGGLPPLLGPAASGKAGETTEP